MAQLASKWWKRDAQRLAILTLVVLGMICAVSIPVSAMATTYTVGTLSDSGVPVADCAIATNTDCSLRTALTLAVSGADTIQFRPGLNGVLPLDPRRGSLILTAAVTISGPGSGALMLDGGANDGTGGVTILSVNPGVVATLHGLTLRHGTGTVVVNGDGGEGGGVFNRGTLTMDQCVISANTAGIGATNGSGGGIANYGTLTVTHSTIIGNSVGNGGNGGSGGGIANYGTLTVTDSNVSGNRTRDVGSPTTLSGNGGGILTDGILTIHTSTITNNSAGRSYGGGIAVTGRGTVTLTESTVDQNTAGLNGGGITIDGTGSIERSTISNNGAGQNGGGIGSYGTVTVATSTISHNTATRAGGGIWSNTRVILMNSTVAKNSAARGGGMAIDYGGATLGTTLVGTNSGGTGTDIAGVITTDNDYNLIGVTAGVTGLTGAHDVVNRDPQIAELGMNGGTTQTHALLANSPAVNGGGTACTGTDQRGMARPQGTACDIGAYEAQVQAAPVLHREGSSSGGKPPQVLPALHTTIGMGQPGPTPQPSPQPQPFRH